MKMKHLMSFFIILNSAFACQSFDVRNNLVKQDSIINKSKTNRLVSTAWLGTWENNKWQNESSLEIISIKSDSIEFTLLANNGGHVGEIMGMAIVKDNIAIFSDYDQPDTCLIQFTLLSDSVILIDRKHGMCSAGMGVGYSGYYKNVKYISKVELNEDLFSLGILKTEKENTIFKALVGDSYSQFVNSTQLTSELVDLDSLNVIVKSSGVRGLFTFMEYIIMSNSLNEFWAAVIDNNKVYYFTNRKEFKNRLPKTINQWRQRFKEYPIVYQK